MRPLPPHVERSLAQFKERWEAERQADAIAAVGALRRANERFHQRELAAAGMPADSNVSAALVRALREKGMIPPAPAAEAAA